MIFRPFYISSSCQPASEKKAARSNAPAVLAFLVVLLPAAAQTLSVTLPGSYTVTRLATGAAAAAVKPLNNYGQVTGVRSPQGPFESAFLWVPGVSNGTAGTLNDLPMTRVEAINDFGQVVGAATDGVSLWSPYQPHGSSGTLTAFLGIGTQYSNDALAINSFGQIAGLSTGFYFNSFLWTPSAANATTGTATTEPGLINVAINDYGQFVGDTTLFTPSTPNGSTGVITQIQGMGFLTAINNAGVILGTTCPVISGGCLSYRGFVWTPAAPNGNVGTATELLPPSGFPSLQPAALNSQGDVVGSLDRGYSVTPFLYRNGVFYDLSSLSTGLIGGIPTGINDLGQVVITTGGLPFSSASNVYLITPSMSYATSVNPAAGSGVSQVFNFEFGDDQSAGNMGVLDILIDSALDGRQACYLAYDRQAGKLYLVNDEGTALLSGLTNSQCTVAGYSVTTNGTSLTLSLNLSFLPGFSGNKIVYMAARDLAGYSRGWQPMGIWNVPGQPAAAVAAVGVSPNFGSGASHAFSFTVSDTKGVQDLGVVDILINQSLDGRQACYLAYSVPLATVYLVNDAGTSLLPGIALIGGSASLSNSQCFVRAAGPATVNGNSLTFTLQVAFAPELTSNLLIYLAARDSLDANGSGWQPMGVWSPGT